MKPNIKEFFKQFSVELLLYGVLVLGYFFLVLHFLGGWLYRLFVEQRSVYAAVALGLMLGQGLVLEILTSVLLRWIRSRRRE